MGPGGADAFGLRRNVLAVEGDNPVRKPRLDLLVCAAPFSAPPSLGAPFSLTSILRRYSVKPCKFPDKVIDDVDDCPQTLLVVGFPGLESHDFKSAKIGVNQFPCLSINKIKRQKWRCGTR
jgi:hypothetical protein